MTNQQKIDKLKEFKDEKEFREFLISLLKKMGFRDVYHTHKYGAPELGKDIIAKISHPIEGDEWYAFVVKLGRIRGGTIEVEMIKGQISQSFEYPYITINGEHLKVSKVKVVTNENFSNGAQSSISNSLVLKTYNNYGFWWNETLVQSIDDKYADFWLPGDEFIKSYSTELKKRIHSEFELKELSLNKIDDKNVQKLIDIFIEPNMTEIGIEDNEDKIKGKKYKRKKIAFNAFTSSNENFIIVGEAGAGKSKILNNIITEILDDPTISQKKSLPIKLTAKNIGVANFNIEKAISEYIALITDINVPNDIQNYHFQLFIDEIDLLSKEEQELLFDELNVFCSGKHRFFLTKRRNYNIEVDETTLVARTIRIHNFNINQVKNFIEKFFDDEKGSRFISILRESNILQKLPTTPLTITLLSLLYDGNNYEIPATLTDIYDDFTSVLLGKLEIRSKIDLLAYNIKKRLFTIIALEMLTNKRVDLEFKEFKETINSFLLSRGYEQQSDYELTAIIENSGILFIDENDRVGFKQQAFVEYLASVEIYDHPKNNDYHNLLKNFNDVAWQSTAIFYAGRSKDLPQMIPDLLAMMPNNDIHDWFINTGGMGYLSQALYQTEPKERKKLVLKSLDNLCLAFKAFKDESKGEGSFFSDIPLPMIAMILNMWFVENFKSITLKQTLIDTFDELLIDYKDATVNDFFGDFKLFMVAAALMNRNIGNDEKFLILTERQSFIKNPLLMIAGDMYLDSGDISKTIKEQPKETFEKVIKQYIKVVKYLVKEPAYKISNDYRLLSPAELKLQDDESLES